MKATVIIVFHRPGSCQGSMSQYRGMQQVLELGGMKSAREVVMHRSRYQSVRSSTGTCRSWVNSRLDVAHMCFWFFGPWSLVLLFFTLNHQGSGNPEHSRNRKHRASRREMDGLDPHGGFEEARKPHIHAYAARRSMMENRRYRGCHRRPPTGGRRMGDIYG